MSSAAPQMTVSPFTDNPDAPVFVETTTHRQAVAQACFGIEQDGGLVVITGEPGSGKSAVLDRIAQLTDDGERLLLRLSATEIGPEGLDQAILEALRRHDHGIDPDMSLDDALEFCRDDNVPVALLIDDGSDLDTEGLSALHRLVELDDSGEPLVRIVMAGRPTLRSQLYREELAGLRDSVSSSHILQPLSSEETAEYFDSRVRAAGFSGEIVATPGFLQALTQATSGNPAKINRAAVKAIAAAGIVGRTELRAEDVDVTESDDEITDAVVIETLSASDVASESIEDAAGDTLFVSGKGSADPSFANSRPGTVTVRDINAAIEMLSKPGAKPGARPDVALTPEPPQSPQEMINEPSPLLQTTTVPAAEMTDDIWEPAAPMAADMAEQVDQMPFDTGESLAEGRARSVHEFVDDVRSQIDSLRQTIDQLKSEAERLDERRRAARERISERIRTIEDRLRDLRGE